MTDILGSRKNVWYNERYRTNNEKHPINNERYRMDSG